ncbi:MAG: PSD1 domain-containing protein [Pirellulaceae bacterium]|nr:PSD1 domain-containing protein [Pirellulaceae bacterium]
MPTRVGFAPWFAIVAFRSAIVAFRSAKVACAGTRYFRKSNVDSGSRYFRGAKGDYGNVDSGSRYFRGAKGDYGNVDPGTRYFRGAKGDYGNVDSGSRYFRGAKGDYGKANWGRASLWLAFGLALIGLLAGRVQAQTADELEWFERRVRPLLVQHCYECHSAQTDEPSGGLRLDSREALLAGGELGAAVVPGQPDSSLLIRAIGYADTNLQMPPDGKLPTKDRELLVEWVRRGAPFPAVESSQEAKPAGPRKLTADDLRRGKQFWSLRPLVPTQPASAGADGWSRRRIDLFLAAALRREGLQPSMVADRRTLIRRATFDLLGLPPSQEEVEAFVGDPSPDAYERLIDRLLASPHHGERWGRHWLDVARYTDVTASWLENTGQAWLYRDWVIRALNQDLPYDQFVQRQLAADLMDSSAPADHAALGFLGLSPTYWKELRLAPDVIKTVVAEEWEERIDAVGRSFLGLTLACARCHDHKFDPISMQDYYALAGVFASTRLADQPLIPGGEAERVRDARRQVATLDERIKQVTSERKQADAERQAALDQQLAELDRQRRQLISATPHYDLPWAHGVDEASLLVLPDGPDQTRLEYQPGVAQNVALQIRGNPASPGPLVARRYPAVLSRGEPEPFRAGSGRRELAEAIFEQSPALAARVIVNRVWTWHFGRGLVTTPSDFGAQGARPSHPELLDDLAERFIGQGWSLKWLHREIMLSSAYQQSSADDPRRSAVDPENRWLWRMNRRRLELEPWRDAILAACGQLDGRMGGPADELDGSAARRTVYARVHRHELHPLLQLYDFPPPAAHSPARSATTTPLQQLFVLNSPFFRQRSRSLAAAILAEQDGLERRVERLHERLFQRSPIAAELELAREFLSADDGTLAEAERWTDYVQVLLGSNEMMFVD